MRVTKAETTGGGPADARARVKFMLLAPEGPSEILCPGLWLPYWG
jgi:hypothetical protein